MEAPDRNDPASTEIDLTKTEGYPTGKAELQITLPVVGLKLSGNARLSNPVMALAIGVVAAVVITLVAVIVASSSPYALGMVIVAGVMAVICLGISGWLAFQLNKSGARSAGTSAGGAPPEDRN
ncbi:hypothetical protein [Micromonospora sp. SL4-19]|uniref:hypothetical protein n=1 Tax=Micromonospora sp. SL4-19 TaxID=3399129 RepID=UPI003A4D2245